VLAICAIVVTAVVARQDVFPPHAESQSRGQVRQVQDWRAYGAAGHREGPMNAPVNIVEFADFQCPACRTFASTLKAIRSEFPREVAVTYRHAPLPIHPFAVAAAQASECAADQGRFKEFHDALFIDQGAIGLAAWTRFAQSAGVPDIAAFERCVDAAAPRAGLARDTTDAARLGVIGTPTVLVNGTAITGALSLDSLRALVRRTLAENAPKS
jgi:protein-disulfide isomerase